MPTGRVVAAYGRQFLVDDGQQVVECVMRGKKGGIACGDRVRFELTHPGSGVIEALEPRTNLLYRSDEMREKLIAANVDQAIVVVAAVPYFREELLIRCLVACATADIPAVIVLNKTDLPETADLARHLTHYAALGYPVLALSARGDLGQLAGHLGDKTSVLVGGSGVGKSTLLNRLVPDAGAATGEISIALDAGKHTTTQARLYRLPVEVDASLVSGALRSTGADVVPEDASLTPSPSPACGRGELRATSAEVVQVDASLTPSPSPACGRGELRAAGAGYLIDSPGMQEFGLSHLDQASLMAAFPEISERAGQCRFYNCRHLKEPGCAVREAVERGAMLPVRFKVYQSLLGQLS